MGVPNLMNEVIVKNTLFEFVIERTLERDLKIEFFNHCLSLVKEKAKIGFPFRTGMQESFNLAIVRVAKSRRFDLFHELLNVYFDENQGTFWELSYDLLITLAKFGEVEMLSELVKVRQFYFGSDYLTMIKMSISERNYSNMNFLLNLPKSKTLLAVDFQMVGESLIRSCDLDFLKKFSKDFDFQKYGYFMLKEAVEGKDIEGVDFVLTNLIPKNKKPKIDFLKEMAGKDSNEEIIHLLNIVIGKWSKVNKT